MIIKLILTLPTSPCSRKKHRELPPSSKGVPLEEGGIQGDGLLNNIVFIGQNRCFQYCSSEGMPSAQPLNTLPYNNPIMYSKLLKVENIFNMTAFLFYLFIRRLSVKAPSVVILNPE